MGLQVLGVDIHRTALTRCRMRANVPLFQGNAFNLPFGPQFGVIGLFDCLEHLDHPERVLSEVHRCLKSDGFLLVTVPAVQALYGWVDRLSGHRLRYSREGLVELLESVGFEVVRASYFMSSIFPLLCASRLWSEWRFKQIPDMQKPFCKQFQVLPGINDVLRHLCAVDLHALRFMNLPCGGSLIALARK
jgi:SAM-dependent methyltransferase